MNKLFIFLSLFLFMGSQSKACSCIGPDKFKDSIGELVLQVRVIKMKKVEKFEKGGYSATLVQVERVLKGKYSLDTLKIIDDKGFECFHGLPDNTPSKQYIITGTSIKDQFIGWEYGLNEPDSSIMVLDLCSENILELKDHKVIGNITKNSSGYKKWFLLNYKLRSEENFEEWRYKKNRNSTRKSRLQKMSLARFERKFDLKPKS